MDKKERIKIIKSIISYIKTIDIDYPKTKHFEIFHNNNKMLIKETNRLLKHTINETK